MQIRPQAEDDYPALVELLNTAFGEALTVEEYARQQASRNPEQPYTVLVAVVDGQVVGRAAGGPQPRFLPGDMGCNVVVAQGMRRQGIGGALYTRLLPFFQQYKPARLRAGVSAEQPEAIAWAERRGFVRRFHLLESRLDLSTFAPDRMPTRVPGITLRDFAALRSPENESRLWRLYHDLLADTPDAAFWQQTPRDEWLQWAFQEPASWPEGWLLAIDENGEWVGLTLMQRYTDGSGMAHIFMSGVKQGHRGRGIATGLKVEAARRAKAAGITHLSTLNEAGNQAILAVNRGMGFQRLSGFYRLVRPW